MAEERIFIIPLRVKEAPRRKRTPKAVRAVKEFLKRHMKAERVKISEELNQRLWARGVERPGSRVRVRAVKAEDGSVEAFPA